MVTRLGCFETPIAAADVRSLKGFGCSEGQCLRGANAPKASGCVAWFAQADAMRLKKLHEMGGIYFDWDVSSLTAAHRTAS
jgi:hypothetical protein